MKYHTTQFSSLLLLVFSSQQIVLSTFEGVIQHRYRIIGGNGHSLTATKTYLPNLNRGKRLLSCFY